MVKKTEKIPVMYSVGLKNLPHALGVGNVAAVLLYMHYKTQKDGEDDVEELGHRMIDKKVLWQNGDANANWEAIKMFVDLHLKGWFPEGAIPVQYYERRILGYALEAYQKEEVEKIFQQVFDELNIESDQHWHWDETLELQMSPPEPIRITFKEKHFEAHYLAKSPRDAGNIFMHVLKYCRDNGEYNWMRDTKVSIKKPTYTKEEVDALPASMEKEKITMLETLKQYERELTETERYNKNWTLINKAIDELDPYLAKRLLEQFEGFEISKFDTFDEFNLNLRD